MASHLLLHELTIEGPGKQPAAITLKPGLNAIVGATGTGKSYIFDAIDFCLGASEMQKDPTEAKGYKTAVLKLKVGGIDQYALSRNLSGGSITVNPCLDWNPQLLGGEVCSQKHDEKRSLSAWLLRQIGITGLKVFKNNRLERQAFSFRNVAHLAMVDENRVIAKHSPANVGQDRSNTSDQRAFNVAITGEGDETDLPEAPTKAKRDLRIDGKIDWVSKEVVRLEALLKPFTDNGENPMSRVAALDQQIEAATSIVTATKARVAELDKERLAKRQAVFAATDLIKGIDERVKQFRVLRSLYDTDTDRISATLEAGHAFERLPGGHCAVCGMLPDSDSHASHSIDIYMEAASSELAKLGRLKSDLDETLAGLGDERTRAEAEAKFASQSLELIERDIAELLKPQSTTSPEHLKVLLRERHEASRAVDAQTNRDRLRIELLDLEKQKKRTVPKLPQPEKVPAGSIKEFCEVVTETLRAWRFDLATPIKFDERTFDLIVNGQARGGLGKGHRALTHAAFTVSTMRYCLAKGLPHPGFVVLDSPLNPFKGITQQEDGEPRVSHEVQDAFYTDLANRSLAEQYVIIENTEVPSDLVPRINHITFSGNLQQPRAGFFPVSLPN